MLELNLVIEHFSLVVFALLVLYVLRYVFSEEIFEAFLVVLLDVFYLFFLLKFLFELLDFVLPEQIEPWQFVLLFKFNHFLAE